MQQRCITTKAGGIWVTNKPLFITIASIKCMLFYKGNRIIACNLQTKQRILDREAHETRITGILSFISELRFGANLVLSASIDGTVKVWKLTQREGEPADASCFLKMSLIHTEKFEAYICKIVDFEKMMTFNGYTFYALLKNVKRSVPVPSKMVMVSEQDNDFAQPVYEVARITLTVNDTVDAHLPMKHERKAVGQLLVALKTCFQCQKFQDVECFSTSSTGNYVALTAARDLLVYSYIQHAWFVLTNAAHIKSMLIHPFEKFIVTGDHYGRLVRWYCLNSEMFTTSATLLSPHSENSNGIFKDASAVSDAVIHEVTPLHDLAYKEGGESVVQGVLAERGYSEGGKGSQEASITFDGLDTVSVASLYPEISLKCVEAHFKSFERRLVCPTSTSHWHAHAVSSLCFSNDGFYLLSGGEEAVLVIWHVDRPDKQFLPRLGAPILHITSSPDDLYFSVSLGNNTIHIIDSVHLSIDTSLHGIDLPIFQAPLPKRLTDEHDFDVQELPTQNLVNSAADFLNCLTLNSDHHSFVHLQKQKLQNYVLNEMQDAPIRIQPLQVESIRPTDKMREIVVVHSDKDRIQLFDLLADRHVAHLNMQSRQYVSRVDDAFGAEWVVGQIAFSKDGKFLATSLSRPNLSSDDVATARPPPHTFEDIAFTENKKMFVLNFWYIKNDVLNQLCKDETLFDVKGELVLQTRVENPHHDEITSILPHNTPSGCALIHVDYRSLIVIPASHYKLELQTTKRLQLLSLMVIAHFLQDSAYFLSFSLDSLFKGWKLTRHSEENTASSWLCITVGSFQKHPCLCSTLSMDASVLVISHGFVISVWQTLENALLNTLPVPSSIHDFNDGTENSDICKSLGIIENEFGPFLAAITSDRVIVWNLIDFSIMFFKSYKGLVDLLFLEPFIGSHFAVVSAHDDKELYHQLTIFGFSRNSIDSSDHDTSVKVAIIHEEKRVQQDAFILDGYFMLSCLQSSPYTHENNISRFSPQLLTLTSEFELYTTNISDSNNSSEPLHIIEVNTLDQNNSNNSAVESEKINITAGLNTAVPSDEHKKHLHLFTEFTPVNKELQQYPPPLCREYLSNYYRNYNVSDNRSSSIDSLTHRGPSHLSVPPSILLRSLLKQYTYRDLDIHFEALDTTVSRTFEYGEKVESSDKSHSKSFVPELPDISFLQSLVDGVS